MHRAVPFTLLLLAGLLPGTGCDSAYVPVGCPDGKHSVRGQCLYGHEVRLNAVGYLAQRRKVASFAAGGPSFRIRREKTDEVVLHGEATGPKANSDTDEMLYHVDFTELTQSGTYYFDIGPADSAVFQVGRGRLEGALESAMLGLYGQRCGEAVAINVGVNHFFHQSCHLQEADFSRIGEGTRDDSGGWHDAGDYGKYTRNGAFAVYFLVRAFEQFPEYLTDKAFLLPETEGSTPDILDEARVELEWLLKVQLDDGSFSHKVTKINFEVDVMPSVDVQRRFFVSASTTATANSVAALAQAARVYAPFDAKFAARCLKAARAGQAFLDEHPESIGPDQADINTGAYGCSTVDCGDRDADERAWALVELWETTGEGPLLAEAETRLAEEELGLNFDWSNTQNLALSTYALSAREGRNPALLRQVRWQIQDTARTISKNATDHGYGRGFGDYYWGANGSIARLSYNLIAAHRLAPDTSLLDALTAQLDHLMGHNAYSRSFITGVGADPVLRPHHRPSTADSVIEPWPGLLIGGPHAQGTDDPIAKMHPALAWTDEAANYFHNEIAINWNSALVYALAAALATEKEGSAACQPDCLVNPHPDGAGGAAGGAGPGSAGAGPGGAAGAGASPRSD